MVESSVVILDSCVLYPAPLRDLLISLAQTNLFSAKWTNDIHEEWIRNVLKNRKDLSREKLERTRELMNNSLRDCLISGYESIIPIIKLPDPNDRHVLAAAIRIKADSIITFNLKDFPTNIIKAYDIEAQHPDEFISALIDIAPGMVFSAIGSLRKSLRKPPKSGDEYLEILERQALPQTVAILRDFIALI